MMLIKEIEEDTKRWKSIPTQTINVGDVERRESFYTVAGECKLVQPLWKTVWNSLKN